MEHNGLHYPLPIAQAILDSKPNTLITPKTTEIESIKEKEADE